MKNTITLLVALVLAISLHAQKGSFVKNYLKLRQPTEENFAVQTFKGKELKHWVDSLKSETTEETKEEVRFLEKAKEVSVVIDMDKEGQLSSEQLEKLLQPYEELTSMEVKQMSIGIRGVMQKDKIKELLVLVESKSDGLLSMLFGNTLIVVDMIFKKPITLEELGNLEDVSKLISISDNEEVEGENDALVSYDMNWTLEPNIKKIEVAKENRLYGVKSFSSNGEESHFMIQPQYKNEIVIYRSKNLNSNAYIKIRTDDDTANLLYDQHGFQIVEAKDITPVYMPDSDLVVYFIIDKGGLYSLYECPEEYKQTHNGKIGPHINYRIEDCQSIKLMDNHTLECKKTDGSVEVIAIEKK